MEDETTMETMETTEEDGFLDGWDDEEAETTPEMEDSTAEDGTESPVEAPGTPADDAEEPPESDAPEENQPQEQAQTPQETPKTWTLTHQGQPVRVGEQDLAMLAQRGLDSVRLQQELDEARPMMKLLSDFAKQANMSPKEYVSKLRMEVMQSRGMTQEEAKRAVDLEDREANVKAQEAAEQARRAQMQQAQEQARNLEAKRRAEVQEFLQVFPDALKAGQLPPAVWEGVNQGLSLTASYARFLNAKNAAEQAAAEEAAQQQEALAQQAAANAARSTGSLRSAGSNKGPKDPFIEGFDSD